MTLMGWRGAGGGGAASTGWYYFAGGLLMILGGLGEWILGNTFPFVVFCSFGAFWLGFAATLQPFYNAYGAYADPNVAGSTGLESIGYNVGLAYFLIMMSILCLVYLICSIRTNLIFFLIFFTLVPAFSLLAGSYLQAANGRAALAAKLAEASGAFCFVTCLCGWYIFLAIMLASVDFPLDLPLVDLSSVISGASEKRANRGIGLEFVRQLAAKPSNTIIAGVRSKSGDISELEGLNSNSNIHIIECDVSSLDSLSSIEFRVAEILTKTGASLDFLFNVAGINATSTTDTSLTLNPKRLNEHMQTNVLGPAKIVESLRKYLARGATVLNMSSGLGSLTVATDVTKCCTYSMSKAALNMLTLHQAKDLKAHGVKVICMDPGWVKTRMGGKGAVIEAKVSVESMLDVVTGLKDIDSGKFYRYDGAPVPW
ncbi:hypothetical protein G6011_10385 [Alternaria panax]|uniref:Uncharacterized protein n=1 Tax=Alternaria panax TaxID=48097 RepID=A0AAD4IBH1_9PLEO|nr:hypothetical protein G6011_10385 [Alternaria panax]